MAFVPPTRRDMQSSIPPAREGHSTPTTSSRRETVTLSDIMMEMKRARKETAQLPSELLSSIEGVQDELKELKRRTFQIKGGEFQVRSKTNMSHKTTSLVTAHTMILEAASWWFMIIYHALCEFIISSSML